MSAHAATNALAGAAFDPTELLDVDVQELARPRALVPERLLEAKPSELAHPDPGQDPETVESAIPSVSAISAAVKRSRRSFAIASTHSGAVRLATGRGAEERSTSSGPFKPVAADPLPHTTDADTNSRRRRSHRPTLIDDQLAQPPRAIPAESRVSVKIHPESSLGPSCL